jgi:hypothetical protein
MRLISRGLAGVCILTVLLAACPLAAQPLRPAPTALADVRTCPRIQCEITLERGTLDGTRIRIGAPGTTIPVGFLGGNVLTRLSAVPAAKTEARASRRARIGGVATTVVTLLAVGAALGADTWGRDDGHKTVRYVGALAVAGSGIAIWHHLVDTADAHLEEATRRYNRELPP